MWCYACSLIAPAASTAPCSFSWLLYPQSWFSTEILTEGQILCEKKMQGGQIGANMKKLPAMKLSDFFVITSKTRSFSGGWVTGTIKWSTLYRSGIEKRWAFQLER